MNVFDQVKHIPHGLKSIAEWLGTGGHVVDRATAQARADVCNICPQNFRGFAVSGAVASAIKRHLEVKNHLGLRVTGEKQLGICDVCGCALRLQVHQSGDRVKSQMTEDERAQLPNHCWKLKLP